MEKALQTKETSCQPAGVTPNLESRINALKGSGQSLPDTVRNYFESRFGYDFGHVRIHTNSDAEKINRDLHAEAFTCGRDIYFGAGRYSPETLNGKRLLAHELTHVLQQEGGHGSILSIQMYRRNVHYDETKRWAEAFFGSGSREAETIAREDQGLDEGWTHPTVTSIGSFLNPLVSDRDLLHFPNRETARTNLRNAIERLDINAFGRALHRFQDSFSHSFPPPPGTGYNLDSKARHNNEYERTMATILRYSGAQSIYPNTLYGRGAVIRHVILGHYPDDFLRNPEQSARDNQMMRETINFIREFHYFWTTLSPLMVPFPPGLRLPSLIFGPAHVSPYIIRRP